jgi:hypothetical protein
MRALAGLALVSLVACDSRATASDPGTRAEQQSKEYESCGASMHCQEGLRCLDHVCRRGARSIVGDYHVAAGAAASARGDHTAAVEAYAAAIGHYNAEKIVVPPDVECAQGGALAAAKDQREHARLAARVLHRCVLAVPAGSALHQRALADLTTLADVGLDPLLLGSSQPADQYLTKDVAPATEKLEITVSATPTPTGKHWPKIPEKLGGPDLRPQLIDCWVKHHAATRNKQLSATLPLKNSFAANPDYEGEGTWMARLEAPSGVHEACVHAVVEPALKTLRVPERIETRLTINIQ